jgi:hypothetical protein
VTLTETLLDLTPPGTIVRCYRNLRAGVPTWSVQTYARIEGTRRHQWRVAGHANSVALIKATFKVYEAGRQRVLFTKSKNVHSYVKGELLAYDGLPYTQADGPARRIAYNPYRLPYFHLTEAGDARVDAADAVWLTEAGVAYAVGITPTPPPLP